MSDLINRQDAIETIVKTLSIKGESYLLPGEKKIVEILKKQPTADVRENVHGEWIKETENCVMGEGYIWLCSRCQNRVYVDTNGKFPKFCEECGAKMCGKLYGKTIDSVYTDETHEEYVKEEDDGSQKKSS